MALVDARGGVRVRVPHNVPSDHWLAHTMGLDPARRFAARYGGDTVVVPRCAQRLKAVRDREILEAFDRGDSAPTIARRHRLTERTIRRILARSDVDDRQLLLFDDTQRQG